MTSKPAPASLSLQPSFSNCRLLNIPRMVRDPLAVCDAFEGTWRFRSGPGWLIHHSMNPRAPAAAAKSCLCRRWAHTSFLQAKRASLFSSIQRGCCCPTATPPPPIQVCSQAAELLRLKICWAEFQRRLTRAAGATESSVHLNSP